MIVSRVSPQLFAVGENIQIGTWNNYINKIENNNLRNFENKLEYCRQINAPDKPSRLNCVFAFQNSGDVDGFLLENNYLDFQIYHLDISNTQYSIHNYRIISYFFSRIKIGDIESFERDKDLMILYWDSEIQQPLSASTGEILQFVPEVLIGSPPLIINIS